MSLKFKEHHPRNSHSHTLGGREQIRAFWALKKLQIRQRHKQISWCSLHSSLCVPMYQSERTCERRYLKSSPNAESASLAVSHFPSVLHCLANFALVKLQCGSGLGSGSFILDFSLLSGPWPWESKFCAQVSKPLCKLLVENKQQKQLIDRAKPNDGWCTPNLPTVPFHYHFDLYGGILTKTLVEKRSVFLSLLQ